jgi:hypothetical protein
MKPQAHTLNELPHPERWIVVNGQTGECMSTPPEGYKPGFNVNLTEGMLRARREMGRPQKVLAVPERPGYGNDYWMHVVGDVGDGIEITGRHCHVFVEGKVGKGSVIKVAEGLVSAASLDEGASVISAFPVLLGNLDGSAKSRNLAGEARNDDPVLLQVPSARRRDIYRTALSDAGQKLCFSSPDDQLARSLQKMKASRQITKAFCPSHHDLQPALKKADLLGSRSVV